MAEAALSKSLDDLIKEQRQTRQKTTKPRREQPGDKAAPKVVAPGSALGAGPRHRRGPGIAPANLSVTIQGAVAKPRRAPPPPRMRPDPERINPELRLAKLEGNERWSHDMFEGERPRGPRAPSALGTKLFISNLEYKVTKEDIGELFETCGPLASYDIHWDASGRSEGTAEVVFKARADAEKALRQFNNVLLDGQPMGITLIEKLERGAVEGRRLKSGLMLSAPSAGPRVLTVTRSAAQAVASAISQPRGRGSVRSQVVAMQE